MASFTGVGDNVTLTVNDIGDTVSVAISGTYNMIIALQREVHPNSGAYVEMERWFTANATVAHSFVNEFKDQKYRLVVLVDTSGTATATLSNSGSQNLVGIKIFDDHGDGQVEIRQTDVRFMQDVTIDGTLTQSGAQAVTGTTTGPAPVDATASTLAVTAALHAGKTVTLNRAAGITVTLPAASGSGNIHRFFVGTTVTSNANIIQVTTTDIIQGVLAVTTDVDGVVFPTAADSDTITMNGSTTGGVIGSHVELEDVASGVWRVSGGLVSTGIEATPFSAAVS